MNASDLAVVLGGLALIAALAWYVFGPRTATHAKAEGCRQVVDITVKGAYSPNLVRVEAGTPADQRPRSSAGQAEAGGRGREQQDAARVVHGLNAEAVGEQASDQQADQAHRVPDEVER
ncbi:MAG: hypothetical protein H0U15_13175, partial [Geodermatophilaceae bacterium]|nr:hypothetical protein [Geodermatophilaceae bacterium]